MRRGHTALLLLVALVALAGCGGNEIPADEVPGSPPTLSLPPDEEPAEASDSGSGNDQDADTDSADAGADADSATGTTGGTTGATEAPAPAVTTPAPETGGTEPEATPAPEDTGGAGGNQDQFEDFCAQNPGAC